MYAEELTHGPVVEMERSKWFPAIRVFGVKILYSRRWFRGTQSTKSQDVSCGKRKNPCRHCGLFSAPVVPTDTVESEGKELT